MLPMRLTAGLALAGLLLAAPALADTCRTGTDLAAAEAAVRAAPSCRAGMAAAKACALGSGGDVALAGAAVELCERDFLPTLGPRARRNYERRRAGCFAKFRHQEGSMYRSAEAFCQAGVAELFSRRNAAAAARRR